MIVNYYLTLISRFPYDLLIEKYSVITNEKYGFKSVSPIPTLEEINIILRNL